MSGLPRRPRRAQGPVLNLPVASPYPVVQKIVNGVLDYAALRAFAQLGLAEHLAHGPLHVSDLAARAFPAPKGENDPPAPTCPGPAGPGPIDQSRVRVESADGLGMLRRVLLMVASLGVVAALPDGRYALTDDGATLISTRPDSLRPAVLMAGESLWWEASRALADTVTHGRPVALGRYSSPYDYLADHPEPAALFDAFMSARTHTLAKALAERDFGGMQQVTDIGGGQGGVLAAVLTAHPHLTGVLLERGSVAERARDHLAVRGLGERCQVIEANMFNDPIPADSDVYLLTSVLHNWGDELVAKLLRRIADALAATQPRDRGGQLWCVDAVLPAVDPPHQLLALDLRMMSLFPEARERSLPELTSLMTAAGLRIASVTAMPHGLSLLIAEPIHT